MTRYAILALAFAIVATPALAQTTSGSSKSPAAGKTASAMTQKFVKNAAITDLFEIQAGKMAQDKASDPAYKNFAKMIIDDHTKTSQQMEAMQPQLGVEIPTALDTKHKGLIDKLQSASGATFENQFKSAQVDGHKAAIKLYEDYAAKGDNPELRQFAQTTLPTLKEHLQHARALPKARPAPTVGSGLKMK